MPNKLPFINEIKNITPLKDNIIARDMNFEGRQLSSGIFLLSDDGKSDGIRPRWAKVYSIGPEQKDVDVGQWIMVEHGRWTHGFDVDINGERLTLRKIDPKAVMVISDDDPYYDDNISTAVIADRKSRTQFE